MSLAQLQIYHLRNIQSAKLEFHPHINFFFGNNGSGKTSLLEAIYLLGTGHSFRSREILPLITHGQESLTVFARADDDQTISIQKALNTPTQVRINSLPCQTSSELARFLPCQVFYQDIFEIIDAGPGIRRSIMDWGLFHVKHDYLLLWKNYKRALRQRNTLLKHQSAPEQLLPWNKILAELGIQLHEARSNYVAELRPIFTGILQQLTQLDCTLQYFKGWDRRDLGKPLLQILNEGYQQDKLRQSTQYGPHQADLVLHIENLKAKQYLSRGQQKIALFALKLAQAQLNPNPCIYLCDDITSELDESHLMRLFQLIESIKGQFFITALSKSSLFNQFFSNAKCFSLFSGEINDTI